MPDVDRSSDVLRPVAITYSLTAAAVAMPFALLVAVVGQGVGAVLGGCQWIGCTVPVAHQVWALVNQPSLSFASQNQALGYWLGSLLLPLIMGVTMIHLGPRPKNLSAELLALQLAWAGIAIGVAWLPLVDSTDGHLARLFYLRSLPRELVWGAPLVASAAALLPALRVLALARGARHHTGRGIRLWVVTVHLGTPVAAWFVLVSVLRGTVASAQGIALALPLVVAMLVAWLSYPSPYVLPLREINGSAFVRAAIAAALVGTVLWWAGRPLGGDRYSGVLWDTPTSLNNTRPWVRAEQFSADDEPRK